MIDNESIKEKWNKMGNMYLENSLKTNGTYGVDLAKSLEVVEEDKLLINTVDSILLSYLIRISD